MSYGCGKPNDVKPTIWESFIHVYTQNMVILVVVQNWLHHKSQLQIYCDSWVFAPHGHQKTAHCGSVTILESQGWCMTQVTNPVFFLLIAKPLYTRVKSFIISFFFRQTQISNCQIYPI